MKTTVTFFAIFAAMLFATSLAADTIHDQLNGTWSGSWIPEGGIRDAMTIELKHDESRKLTGRFVLPLRSTLPRRHSIPRHVCSR